MSKSMEMRALSSFRQLLEFFSSQLSPPGLETLRKFCAVNHLLRKEQCEGMHAAYILGNLVDYLLVNEDNLQIPKYVVRACGQNELLELLESFEQRLPLLIDPLHPNSQHPAPNVKGYTSANVIVQKKVTEMDRKTIQSLCMSLADVSCIQYHQLAWVGYIEGQDDTVVLMTILPTSCLSRLQSRLNAEEDRTLKELGILDVETVQNSEIPEVASPQVEELLRRIGDGEAPTANAIISAVGRAVPQDVIDSLLFHAAECNNADALHHLESLMVDLELYRPGCAIVDVLMEKEVTLGVGLLVNAYTAGRERIVECLLAHDFILDPAVFPYTVLLTTVCQKPDYPASLLQSLLEQEDNIDRPFQDRTREDVYDVCITYCCSNDRDDLVALLIKRYNTIPAAAENHPACVGRAMSRIGTRSYAMRIRRGSVVICVDICWRNLNLVHLSNAWLSEANLGGFITKLDVSGNQLSSIPYSLLDGTLQILEFVDCSQNKLKSLWRDDLPGPTTATRYRLKVLNVSNNELKEIPLHVFQIPSLEVLNVSHNFLTTLPGPEILMETTSTGKSDSNGTAQQYWQCKQLKEMYAFGNLLNRLPETFGDVPYLRKLILSNNELLSIPRSLSRATFLEQVDLSSNTLGVITEIDTNIGCLPKSVKKLTISNNSLRCIPLTLTSMTSLRELDCANNSIKALPEKQDWKLPHLQTLIVSGNELGGTEGRMEFPESFSRSLTSLDLSHNGLKKFPEAVLTLSMVAYLNLKGNPSIQKLPLDLAVLKHLWELKLDNLGKCINDIDPTFDTARGNIQYSKVKEKLRDKQSNSGSGSPKPRISTMPKALTKGKRAKIDHTKATFKVWNIPGKRSFSVLQHAFFAENTVHLLVWHESDGLSGLADLNESLQLIRPISKSIRTMLVILKTKPLEQETEERLAKLGAMPQLHCSIRAVIRNQKGGISLSPLPEDLVQVAVDMASVYERFAEEPSNRVPAVCRDAASLLFGSQTPIMEAVCLRDLIETKVFPGGIRDPDDFDLATRFFMRIGALLHYEDSPQNLHLYFFPNLDLVSHVIVALHSGSSRHLLSGIATRRHIYAVLSKLSVSHADSGAFFALLMKLRVFLPFDSCHCRYLLPFRLPAVRPGLNLALSQYLTPSVDESSSKDPTYVRRLYSIENLPPSFWGRFISALVLELQTVIDSPEATKSSRKTTNSIFWANGVVTQYEDGCVIVNALTKDDLNVCTEPLEGIVSPCDDEFLVVNAMAKEELSGYSKSRECSKTCLENGLDVIVFDRTRQFAALGWICSRIERLLQEWIVTCGGNPASPASVEATFGSIERFIPYPAFDVSRRHSADEALNDHVFEHTLPGDAALIKLEDCAESIVSRSGKMVAPTGELLNVSLLAPDLTLSNLPSSERLTKTDVTIKTDSLNKASKGGFATVFLGHIGKEEVALKLFGSIDVSQDELQLELNSDHFGDSAISSQRSERQRSARRKSVGRRRMDYSYRSSLAPYLDTEETDWTERNVITSLTLPHLEPFHYFKHLQDLVQEVSVMKQLQHKHVAQFRGVIFQPRPGLVMEFAPCGNLAMLITSRREQMGSVDSLIAGTHFSDIAHDGILSRQLTHRIAFQMALAIEYLHSKSICHLDVKPENVLVWSTSVTAPVNIKLADYGLSCTVTDAGVNSLCGSLGYQAPEQILSRKGRGESFDLRVDIYAYGMTLYFLLTGIHPFEKDFEDISMVEHRVKTNERPPLPTGQSLIHLQSLIERCWQYRPSGRPSASQIVSEMCVLTFQIQCEDLSLAGCHNVLATTYMNEDERDDLEDISDTDSFNPTEEHEVVSVSMSMTGLGQTRARRYRKHQLEKTPALKQSCQAQAGSEETKRNATISPSTSLETIVNKMDEKFEELRSLQYSKFPTDAEFGKVQTVVHQDLQLPTLTPPETYSNLPHCLDEQQPESDKGTISFAIIVTDNSLLVALPQLSYILGSQKLDITPGDVSAIMYLNNSLWIGQRLRHGSGLRSGQLRVFDCTEGHIGRRAKQKLHCSDVIEDIQCQFSNDRDHAKVFALLANGEIMVVQGHRSQETDTDTRQLKLWGKDSIYNWDHPTPRKVGKYGLEDEEADHVMSCIVVAQPDRLWYCQGNSILVLDTEKTDGREPLKVVTVDGSAEDLDGSATDTITIPSMRIKDAVVLGNTVWCSGCDNWSTTLQAIDVVKVSPTGRWTLDELLRERVEDSTARHGTDNIAYRNSLSSCRPKSIQCLATVCDTLWVGCDNGAILVVWRDQEQTLRLLATLWCRPVLSHFQSLKPAETGIPPRVQITKMTQVGDRVLVYRKAQPVSDKQSETTVVAEVFQALDRSQVQEITAYYNVQNA